MQLIAVDIALGCRRWTCDKLLAVRPAALSICQNPCTQQLFPAHVFAAPLLQGRSLQASHRPPTDRPGVQGEKRCTAAEMLQPSVATHSLTHSLTALRRMSSLLLPGRKLAGDAPAACQQAKCAGPPAPHALGTPGFNSTCQPDGTWSVTAAPSGACGLNCMTPTRVNGATW
jgi:hypothetical protein